MFDTVKMTWDLPQNKKKVLVGLLEELLSKSCQWSERQWEVINGKLQHICQLWPPGNFFTDSLMKAQQEAKVRGKMKSSRRVKRDAKVWLAVLKNGVLPIKNSLYGPRLMHFITFSDASGEILDSPGVDMLIPSQFGLLPRAAA